MISGKNVRQMVKELGSVAAYKNKILHLMGRRWDEKLQRFYVDTSASGRLTEDEFPRTNRALCEEFVGHEFIQEYETGQGDLSSSTARAISEDVAPVDATIFQNINAWNSTVGGLVEIRLLEKYRAPTFIAEEFMEIQPTRVNGGKVIGIPYPNPQAIKVTGEGVEMPNIGLNQLWVVARPNLPHVGGKLSMTRNALLYDLTGELMSSAEGLGESLRNVKEYYQASMVLGVSQVLSTTYVDQSVFNNIGNSFVMNQEPGASTPNPTYQLTGVTTNTNLPNAYNFINEQSNALSDWTSFQKVRNLLNLMRDPVNNLPFSTAIKKVWVDPYNYELMSYIKHQIQVFNVTGTPVTGYPPQGAASTFPPVMTQAPGRPPLTPEFDVFSWQHHTSNIWHQVLLDSGVTEANAEKYWYAGDPVKAFVWRQAWDARVDQANPNSASLLGRNVIAEWVCSWSGQNVVREPRFMIQNTN